REAGVRGTEGVAMGYALLQHAGRGPDSVRSGELAADAAGARRFGPKKIKYVIGPDGRRLGLADLPLPNTKRWVIRRKAEVVAAGGGGPAWGDGCLPRSPAGSVRDKNPRPPRRALVFAERR